MTGACERFEGAMALAALGALPADERPGLDAHLEGCASCRETFHELTTTAGALALVDAASVAQTASVPAALTERVLGTLHRDARRARRQRVVRMGAAAGIGAVAAAVLAVVALASSPGSPAGQRVLELRGHGATATAVLTGAPWGTSVRFSEEGLPADSVYVVSMRTSSGTWWPAASYEGVAGHEVQLTTTCYAPMDEITGIRVTSGATAVLQTEAPPGTSW